MHDVKLIVFRVFIIPLYEISCNVALLGLYEQKFTRLSHEREQNLFDGLQTARHDGD
jgi:hypothetical protein